MSKRFHLLFLAALALPASSHAQLGLPGQTIVGGLPGVGALPGVVDRTVNRIGLPEIDRLPVGRVAQRLLDLRAQRLTALVRDSDGMVVLDDRGYPAASGTILIIGASAAERNALNAAGYRLTSERIDGLDLSYDQVTLTADQPLPRALRAVRKLAPGAKVSADNIYSASGSNLGAMPPLTMMAAAATAGEGAIGLIDGGVAAHPSLKGPIEQRGFARGAPTPSAHGTAVASLLVGNGTIRGPAPGAPLLVADIYGRDPSGGGALALARALGWMAAKRARVVTISLVGPDNPLLGGAIQLARDRGMAIVAAVGNDGPAAPPAFPASYPAVVAVTGVDGRNRVIVEAGRARHIDFAAPGADMRAGGLASDAIAVRGTSFAAPLVAARLYQHGRTANAPAALAALASEARDLGKKGRDPVFGHGLICGECRN